MERLIKRFGALLLVLALTSFPAMAFADGSTNGLGSTLPPLPNISANSQYQIFRWVRDGVAYVQVNDASGNVQLAVAAGGGVVLVLPVGLPNNVQVVTADVNAASGRVTVFAGQNVTITTDGTSYFASPVTTPVTNTTAAPATSSTSATPSQTAVQSMAICSNPADCSQ